MAYKLVATINNYNNRKHAGGRQRKYTDRFTLYVHMNENSKCLKYEILLYFWRLLIRFLFMIIVF